MKEKLKELKNMRNKVEIELRHINDEIKKVEQQMLDSDESLYKGKWYCKTEDWWDEFENCYKSYEIVYVEDVILDYGRTHLSVITIKADHYYKLQNFEIEVDENCPVQDLKGMEEMTDFELYEMDDTIKQLIKRLFMTRPSLRNDLIL